MMTKMLMEALAAEVETAKTAAKTAKTSLEIT